MGDLLSDHDAKYIVELPPGDTPQDLGGGRGGKGEDAM